MQGSAATPTGACGLFRAADPLGWWEPRVDIAALQARARREQPIGGGEAETVAFLRTLGFEDRYIYIWRFAITDPRAGRLFRIEAWIPQRRSFYVLTQIRATCKFGNDSRLEECSITRGIPLEPNTSPSIVETTPSPAP